VTNVLEERARFRTVGEASSELGVSPRTLRYYEELGFLVPVRTAGGHRLYSDEDLEILSRVGRMQALGLSLRTISKALHYRSHRDAKTGERRFDAATYATLATDARADARALRLRIVELQRELETARTEAEGLERDAAYFERRLREQQAAETDDGDPR
jgi:MerR family transcriptional regulator, repressor of the yfmOP operon